ncbi:cell division protein FtsQ/DivIB [Nocardioides sp. Leaf285]|uniref:cell division protein FtsQ/DivIB n=1 Tax=Nocardioides sp. Leaf285 TaxID=1736322 RepID=UPI0007030C71|nr:FtsQ-type POTRA domain-containing protein [Nocardioides sp. Leaf285]KQP66752.1 cell division protein FtsQ [Nocardioides sp. Leaf285]
MSEPVDPRTRRTRRRFVRRRWARRWSTLRYAVVGLVLLALGAAAVWTVWFSALLDVEDVEVTGVGPLAADQVRAAAQVPDGEPLARVDLAAVRARVESLSQVASADVTRSWPDAVTISVEERVAVAVVELGGTLRGLDAEGVAFRTYTAAPQGLPRVESQVDTTAEALREAAQVVAALPEDLAGRLDHVEVETVDRIVLALRDGRTVAWGSADESARKAEVLTVLLSQPGTAYDVSVPGRPTVSGPAVG